MSPDRTKTEVESRREFARGISVAPNRDPDTSSGASQACLPLPNGDASPISRSEVCIDRLPTAIVEPKRNGAPLRGTPAADGAIASRVRLSACIILSGGLRRSELVALTGRSVLDTQLTAERTLLDCWVERIAEFAAGLGLDLPVRVVHDSILPPPWPSDRFGTNVTVEREPRAFRGPAGVVRDLCVKYPGPSHVLVVDGSRYVCASLIPMVQEHWARQADITVAANQDDSTAGLYLLRCGTLDLVSPVGYVDLKEQWLRQAVDANLNVRVHRLSRPGALPVRTRWDAVVASRIASYQERRRRT